jgi:hypothetical protein
MIAPFVSAPGNRNESPLLKEALPQVMNQMKREGDAFGTAMLTLCEGAETNV